MNPVTEQECLAATRIIDIHEAVDRRGDLALRLLLEIRDLLAVSKPKDEAQKPQPKKARATRGEKSHPFKRTVQTRD